MLAWMIRFVVLAYCVALVTVVAPLAANLRSQTPAKAAEPLTYDCQWAGGAIRIDGNADEPAWRAAPVIDQFRLPWLGKDDRASKTATRARILWDSEFFYFHADMEDHDLFADVGEHDGETWRNDVFELFFRPDLKKSGYYEFEVNANNTQFDAFFPKWDLNGMAKQVKAGEFRMETKVKLRGKLGAHDGKDTGWSVEGRIPWSDFLRTGGRPTAGETWGISLCRCDYSKDGKSSELSTISPIREKKLPAFFHQIDDYARVRFVAAKPGEGREVLAKRVAIPSSTVIGSPEPPRPYRVKRVLPDVRPSFPIMARMIPGTREMLLITQPAAYGKTTVSRFLADDKSKTANIVKLFETPEGGTAYDIAFHPNFSKNGFVYIGWNGPGKGKIKSKFTRVTRYTIIPHKLEIDPKSAQTIIEWESDGHNGGAICFGKDGFLYVTSGDGTSDSDTDNMGQRTDTLLAKVLRIDVDSPTKDRAYSVPKDNPFVNDSGFAPETWAYGLRNPWRIASDGKTGHIWVGNNGQDLWEQVYFVRKGDNFGWSVVEGGHPFFSSRKPGPTPIVKPVADHHHSEFRSLTGGLVYTGKKLPELQGAYLYGDYSTGRIWGIKHDGASTIWHKELAISTLKITGFTVDAEGELLILDHASEGSSGFYTLEPMPQEIRPNQFPPTLSASGLFENVALHQMKPGVVPYSVNAPFWSDGLYKERFIAIPGDGPIEYRRTRGWNFPDQTVIVKSFALETQEGDPKSRKWIETRFMTKQDGEWAGYSYLWNDAATEATLVEAKGLDKEFTVQTATGLRKQVWHCPSRSECMVCHSRAANFVLGLCSLQMNKSHQYANGAENQLVALQRAGYLKIDFSAEARNLLSERATAKGLKGADAEAFVKHHLPQPDQRGLNPAAVADLLPRLVDPTNVNVDLTLRAKSWLHSNCASCHVEAGGGNAQMELEFNTLLDKMRLLNVKPLHQTFELADPKLVAPGKPTESVLYRRLIIRGQHQMPPVGSNRIDELGAKLIREWIDAMK